MATQDKRRKFYQKRIVLYKSIFSFFIFAGLGVALLSVFYSLFATNIIAYLIDTYQLENASGPIRFVSILLGNHWFYIVVGGLLLISLATFFTHRFAGPLYRFEVSLDRMIDKDFNFKIRLRKNDECQQLAERLNHLNSRMAATLKTMRFLVEAVENNQLRMRETLEGQQYDVMIETLDMTRRLKKMITAYRFE